MRDFPEEYLDHIKLATISSYLMPHPKMRFQVLYLIEMDLPPFLLHEEPPEEAGQHTISLGGLPLQGSRNWRDIQGEYRYGFDEIEGNIRARGSWLPVDLSYAQIQHISETQFQIDCDLDFHMECWDSCYRDFSKQVSTQAEFIGFRTQLNMLEVEQYPTALDYLRDFLSEFLEMRSYCNLACTGAHVTMDPAWYTGV